MSTQGQGDGGVYVSTQGPASYGLGTDDYEVNIIKDCFGVERVDEYLGKGNLDVILIYGCTAAILDQTPGGRDNAKMFSKSTFGCLSLKHANGNYFLRPDRILGAFKVDHSVKFVLDESNMNRLDNEIKSDHKAVETLTLYETMTRKNISRVDDALNTIRKLTTPIHDSKLGIVKQKRVDTRKSSSIIDSTLTMIGRSIRSASTAIIPPNQNRNNNATTLDNTHDINPQNGIQELERNPSILFEYELTGEANNRLSQVVLKNTEDDSSTTNPINTTTIHHTCI